MTPARRRVLEGVVATLGLYMQRVEYDHGPELVELADKIMRAARALRARGRERIQERNSEDFKPGFAPAFLRKRHEDD